MDAVWDGDMSCDCDLDFLSSFKNNHVWSISRILFELGIPNLVCGCILGWHKVSFCSLRVTVTLTYFLESSCQEHISYII